MKRFYGRLGKGMLMAGVLTMAMGMGSCRYVDNRIADFGDIFQMGVGVNTERPGGLIMPHALGVHLQVTDYLPLGWYSYEGYSVEWDGRGAFAGKERRARTSFFFIDQFGEFHQDYDGGAGNYFKKPDSLWEQRMASGDLNWRGTPAKKLSLDDVAYWEGGVVHHRGWQHNKNIGLELGISEPFITNLGLTMRFGIDPSEIIDFVLGLALIDVMKKDDMTPEEHEEATRSFFHRGGYRFESTNGWRSAPPRPAGEVEETPEVEGEDEEASSLPGISIEQPA